MGIKLEKFLEHHGIKGQKWGIRNAAGKPTKSKSTYSKPAHRLSDDELQRRVKRLEIEKRYTDLNKGSKSSGHTYVENLLKQNGNAIVGTVVGTSTAFIVKTALKKKFG